MDETFTKARAYLAQNYSDPELSLTDLCQYLGFSCSYFSTLFKQKTGLNYSRYITSLRLEQAAKLLTDTDDTALSIGYQVGYSAPNYFCRAFKKMCIRDRYCTVKMFFPVYFKPSLVPSFTLTNAGTAISGFTVLMSTA